MNELVSNIAAWMPGFLATLGGTTVVIGGIFGWLGKRYLDRALEVERHHHAEAIERLKSSQDKRVFVYKSQFEIEFETYQNIWSTSAILMDKVTRLLNVYLLAEKPEHRGTKRALGDEADTALATAVSACHSHEPFIAEEVRDLAVDYIYLCRLEIKMFYDCLKIETDEEYDPNLALNEASKDHAKTKAARAGLEKAIRSRLAALSVINV